MVDQARGSDTQIVLYEEDTYGQDPATPNGHVVHTTGCSIQPNQNRIDSQTFTGDRGKSKPAEGNKNVSGALPMEVAAEDMGLLLKHAFGVVATSGTGPYTHEFTIGDLPTSLLVEEYFGSAIATGGYHKHNGCRVGSARFRFPQEGYCTAEFSMMGADTTPADATLDGTATDNGHTSFSAFSATINEGGSASAIITDGEVTLDNGLDGSQFVVGGGGVRSGLPEGDAMVSGRITALFESMDLLNKALNGTESSLEFILSRGTGDGSAGNEYFGLLVQQLVYEVSGPTIDGPAGIVVPLTFKGFKSGSDLGLKATLKNQVASY